MKRIVIPVAAVAVLAIGGAWWLVLRNSADGEAQSAAAAASTDAKGVSRDSRSPLRPEPMPVGTARPVVAPASIALRDEIRDAPDLRAYYERVKDLPDPKGERSYRLAEAIFQCTIFVDQSIAQLSRRLTITPAKPEQEPKRQRLLTAMSQRCKGFDRMGAGLLEITQPLHRRAEAAGYPAEIARSLRFEPAVLDLERADAVAMQLLASSPDPEVLLEMQRYLDARNGAEWIRSMKTDVLMWTFGWGLLQCDYGADCGPRSQPVMMVCIMRGACDSTRVEEVIYIQGGQAALNGADNLRTQLQRRIAGQDWVGIGFIERSSK